MQTWSILFAIVHQLLYCALSYYMILWTLDHLIPIQICWIGRWQVSHLAACFHFQYFFCSYWLVYVNLFTDLLTLSVCRTWSAAFLFSFHTFRKNTSKLQCIFPFWEIYFSGTLWTIYRYMLAEGLGLSGIVSILFTGMVSAIAIHHIVYSCLYCGYTWHISYLSSGYEALHIFQSVRQLTTLCFRLFPFTVIFSWNICVSIRSTFSWVIA
jgi:hypothetical protein